MKGKPRAPVGETRVAPLEDDQRREKVDRTRIGRLRDGDRRDPRSTDERLRPGRETRAAPIEYDEEDDRRPGRETRAAPIDYDLDDDEPRRPGRETRAAPPDYDLDSTSPPNDPSVISSIPPINETRVAPIDLDLSSSNPGLPPPGEADSSRTTFSYQAIVFADAIRGRFAKKIYGRNPNRVVRVDEPEGPSTAGGLLARQPVSLVPRKGVAPALVCGWFDIFRKEAQFRSYESLMARHQARHGERPNLTQAEYERFLEELLDSLGAAQFRITLLVPDEKEDAPEPAPRKRPKRLSGSGMLVAWGVLLALVSFAAGLAVERGTHVTERLPLRAPAVKR